MEGGRRDLALNAVMPNESGVCQATRCYQQLSENPLTEEKESKQSSLSFIMIIVVLVLKQMVGLPLSPTAVCIHICLG